MMKKLVIVLVLGMLFTGGFSPALAKKKDVEQPQQNLKATVEQSKPQGRPIIIKDPNNVVGVTYAENIVNKLEFYVSEKDYVSAQETLTPIKDWLNKATEHHTDLYKALSKVNNSEVQADIEKTLAIKFAVLRDKALFLESKILLAQGKKREAVNNLVEVVRSQPSTDIGFQSYKSLQDIGFTYKVEFTK